MRITLTLFVLILIGLTTSSYAQDSSPERKYYNLQEAESGIFKLPFHIDSIRNVIYLETIAQRRQLAPHYPDISTIARTEEARQNAFYSWIDVYPTEYSEYYSYLTIYIRLNSH